MHVPTPREDRALEFEVEAVLGPNRDLQVVEVSAAGLPLATWTFTPDDNRAVRAMRLPRPRGRKTGASVALTFTPRSVMRAADVHDCGDPRTLGLGLHRMRWGEPAPRRRRRLRWP
jgi:hypothetical protein